MKLFDDDSIDNSIDSVNSEAEHSQVNDLNEDEDEVIQRPVFKRDKIFNNDFNTGNLDYEEYDLPQVDNFYSEQNLADCYDSYEYTRSKTLEELVDRYFKESKYKEILSMKKIPKQMIPFIFTAIKTRFGGNEYTCAEIFSSVAEYFKFSYETLYENIPSVYREQLVKELDDKYNILKKRGTKRLF